MTPERFEILAEAYGGDVARWPRAERDAAAALMAAEPVRAAAVLAAAKALDAALGAYAAPRSSGSLVERIAASAAAPRPAWFRWLAPVGMGAGLAAACAAGVMVGAQLTAAPAPVNDPDSLVTAIGDEDFSLFLDEEA